MPRPIHLCCNTCWFSHKIEGTHENYEYVECQFESYISSKDPQVDDFLPRVHKLNCICHKWHCMMCYGEITPNTPISSLNLFHSDCLLS